MKNERSEIAGPVLEVARWYAAMDMDSVDRATREQFVKWLRDSPDHMAAFLALTEMAWNIGQMRDLPTVDELVASAADHPSSADGSPLRDREKARVSGRWMSLSIIAALIVVVLGTLFWFRSDFHGRQDFATGIGGVHDFSLQDGSRIKLSTNSEVHARLTSSERKINLMRGEALFTVAKDETRPFVVFTPNIAVRATGTVFGVRDYPGERVQISVTEGSVAVTCRSQAAAVTLLSAGQIATATQCQVAIHRTDAKEMARRLSWTTGKLAFSGETLADVVAEINRFNRRQLVIADPRLANERVVGVFAPTDLDSILPALAESNHVEAQPAADSAEVIRLSKRE